MASLIDRTGQRLELRPFIDPDAPDGDIHDSVTVRIAVADKHRHWSVEAPGFEASELSRLAAVCATLAENGGSGVFAGMGPEFEVGFDATAEDICVVVTFDERFLPPETNEAGYQVQFRTTPAALRSFADGLATEMRALHRQFASGATART